VKFLFLSGNAHLALDPLSQRASGGAELQVALLSRELVARAHQVVILAANSGQSDGIVHEGIRIRLGGRFDTGRPADTLRAFPKIIRVLMQEKPDYVVVYGWTAWLYVLCQLRMIIPFKLVFVCALDAEIDGGFRRANPLRGFLFERGMRLSDGRFAITEHQVSLFRGKGMPCAVTRLLLADWKLTASEAKSVDFLWVARCHAVKRPHLFLDLAERWPTVRCRMISSRQDGALWESVSTRAATLPNVEFLDTIPYSQIQAHFNVAEIFVNTSEHEGVPNTFIHSGLGKTAILSLIVNPDSMFDKFQAGFCAAGDFDKFSSEAVAMLSNRGRLLAAQDECERFVREWHDNAANVKAFVAGLP
jgi:hypothetical protein